MNDHHVAQCLHPVSERGHYGTVQRQLLLARIWFTLVLPLLDSVKLAFSEIKHELQLIDSNKWPATTRTIWQFPFGFMFYDTSLLVSRSFTLEGKSHEVL